MTRVPLAVVGRRPIAHVDARGYVWFEDGSHVQWWVLGDDCWHVPAVAPSLRQRAVDNTPVIESSIRVPGGDVVWRVGAAATGSGDGSVLFECENQASIPVAIGIASVTRSGHVELDVRPVVHTTTSRGLLSAESEVKLPASGAGLPAVPELAAVARGWLALARQGAQITTNDPAIDEALVAARTSLLVHHGGLVAQAKRADRVTAGAVATALTLLGYEHEAGALRQAAKLKPVRRGLPIVEVGGSDAITTDALVLLSQPRIAAETVIAIRRLLVDDAAAKIDCLPGFDDSWRGRSVDVTGLPTNEGTLAYALRWHGEHPALLWEIDKPGAPVSARAIDARWVSDDAAGEVLLATNRG